MPSIFDMIGQAASPDAPQTTATSSLPDGIKSLFAPLMESVVRDAMVRNDPISKLGDVGQALFESSGSGTPFAKNLGALDTQRQQATGGAANMFLQVMGMDRQLEESKAQERRFLANYDLDRQKLAETTRQHNETTRLGERRADLTEASLNAKAATEEQRRKDDENKRMEADHDAARKLSAGQTQNPLAFIKTLDTDPDYIAARATKDWNKANKIMADAASTVGPKMDLPPAQRQQWTAYKNVGDAITDLKGLLQNGTSVIDPSDRAKIAQAWNKIVLHYGMATGRGANYTEGEMAKVVGIAGQSPTDLRYRSVESIKTYLDRLNRFEGGVSQEIDNLIGSRSRPGASTDAPGTPKVDRPLGKITVPQGYRDTGRKTSDGRSIYVTPGGDEVAPPRQ